MSNTNKVNQLTINLSAMQHMF